MALDTLVLNGLNLCDETNWVLEAIDFTPPKKRPEFTPGSDSDGALLIRTPLYENRTVTMTLRVAPQSTMDLALEKIGALVDQLQEAEQNPSGIALEWTPATATKKITLYVLTGEITGVPMVVDGSSAGWYVGRPSPQLTVSLTCRPFGYGTEVTGAAAKSIETGLSTVILTVPSVAGDVPAEARLIVKDTAAVGRRFVEWGLQQRYYDAATALVIDNESLTPVGGSQSTALNASGAYKPGGATKGTIATVLFPEPTICCNTGVLKHVGVFRVKARVYATPSGANYPDQILTRLSWQDGEGPLRANTWAEAITLNKFSELDLGTITITPATAGTQKWLGQIEAKSSGAKAGEDFLHLDYLTLIPVAEGYGKARGLTATSGTAVLGLDNFTTGTLSGNLNARTPPVGAAWATSGAATDWTVTAEGVTRSTKSETEPRFGVFGPALGNSAVTVEATFGNEDGTTIGVITRWVDANNYVFFRWLRKGATGHGSVELGVKVAGVVTTLATFGVAFFLGELKAKFVLTALLDGSLSGTLAIGAGSGGSLPNTVELSGSSSAVAAGGALASGKAGISDEHTGSGTSVRTVRSITGSSVPAIPYCIQPSRSMEVHSDSTITYDATGAYAGPPPEYRGSRIYVPQAGEANRTSRVIVKADRNDLQESDEQTIGDAFTAEVRVTPRYSAIPR